MPKAIWLSEVPVGTFLGGNQFVPHATFVESDCHAGRAPLFWGPRGSLHGQC